MVDFFRDSCHWGPPTCIPSCRQSTSSSATWVLISPWGGSIGRTSDKSSHLSGDGCCRPPSLYHPAAAGLPVVSFRSLGQKSHSSLLCPLTVGTHVRISEGPQVLFLRLKVKDKAASCLLFGVEWHLTQSISMFLIEEISRRIFYLFFLCFYILIVNEGFKSGLTSTCPPALTVLTRGASLECGFHCLRSSDVLCDITYPRPDSC